MSGPDISTIESRVDAACLDDTKLAELRQKTERLDVAIIDVQATTKKLIANLRSEKIFIRHQIEAREEAIRRGIMRELRKQLDMRESRGGVARLPRYRLASKSPTTNEQHGVQEAR